MPETRATSITPRLCAAAAGAASFRRNRSCGPRCACWPTLSAVRTTTATASSCATCSASSPPVSGTVSVGRQCADLCVIGLESSHSSCCMGPRGSADLCVCESSCHDMNLCLASSCISGNELPDVSFFFCPVSSASRLSSPAIVRSTLCQHSPHHCLMRPPLCSGG